MPKGLDTNILVYALDSEAGRKHEIAYSIVENMLKNPSGYTVAVQTIALACKNHGIRWIISLDEDFSRIPWLQILH